MAILSNGKFYGFLCSVKETGQKLANGVKEYVEDFASGFAGHGWKIWEYVKGKWMLEIDAIRVRGQFTVFELLVSRIRAIIGAQIITQGCGKIKTVEFSEDGTAYLITLEDKDMSFVEHDFIRCQEFAGDKRTYHVEIESVIDGKIRIPITEFTSETDDEGNVIITNPPLAGDDIVQFGNSSYAAAYVGRHSAIYMHADESGQPAIDVLDGIYTKSWSDCLKVRMGGDIPGTDGLKGFYCVNGMMKGTDNDGHTVYCIYPDGTAEFGDGSARFATDRSGHIAGGAISWEWNEKKGKYVCTMNDVVLTWENLSDEAKENLKGEPGKDGENGQNGKDGVDGQDGAPGRDGINGADGVNGADGISLIYKGEFDSHPTSPQQGWYYRNTTDKKCYVFQDNAWYVMTVDGSDGKNGLDGVNGKDGNDGLDIVWKGDSPTPPTNPQKNWVYRDTDNGRVYIYNGTAWQLMVADGNDGVNGTDGAPGADGKDGMSVFITYHDGEEEPAIPTGDGTAEGWHTDATVSVVWMSQKVSESADTGSWGSPIRIKGDIGEPGQDANLLPWVEDWNKHWTKIGEEYIVSPKMFCGASTGTDDNPMLTGIALGRDCITEKDGNKRTGIFALVNNELIFELDPISERNIFRGVIEATTGKIGGFNIENNKLKSDNGTGSLTIGDDMVRFLRINDNTSSSMLSIRNDKGGGISVSAGDEKIALHVNGNGARSAIESFGSHIFGCRKDERWNAPGVLAAGHSDGINFSYWTQGAPLRARKEGTGQWIIEHDLKTTDYYVMIQAQEDKWDTYGSSTLRYKNANSFAFRVRYGAVAADFAWDVVVIGNNFHLWADKLS